MINTVELIGQNKCMELQGLLRFQLKEGSVNVQKLDGIVEVTLRLNEEAKPHEFEIIKDVAERNHLTLEEVCEFGHTRNNYKYLFKVRDQK